MLMGFILLTLTNSVEAQSTTATNLQNFPQTRFLGFSNNFGVSLRTANITRMWVNPNGTTYNGIATDGYIGIGFDPTDVRSRLTITGTNNSPSFGGGGFRAWMKTGVFNLENSDNLYIGMKEEGLNRSDAILAFGDDNAGLPNPLNNFRILFTVAGSPNASHLEIARYTAGGNIGFGPVFGDAITTVPMSLLHLNRSGNTATFLQVSNQNGTGQTVDDGLRLGISPVGAQTNAYLRWQENTPFIVQTDWDNTPGGITSGERLRITTIGAPGVISPLNPPDNNITRIAISHRGSEPITNPRSLLHLGYNTSSVLGIQFNDGWRPWMDVGIFTAQDSDNMYIGLKREGNDRQDAVINWGDNQPTTADGPDKLRFIFTSTTTALPPGQGDPVSQSQDGLEMGRFYPAKDTIFTYNVDDPSTLTPPTDYYGRFGVGDFTSQGVNEEPTHKLDVVGNGRFRFLPDSLYYADSTVNKYVMVDSAGVLRWTDGAPSGSGVGNYCSDTPSPLTDDFEIPLNGNNYYFEGQGAGINNIAMGLPCPTPLLFSKLTVLQSVGNPIFNPGIGISGHFLNTMPSGVLSVSVLGQNTSTASGQNFAGVFQTTGVNSSALNVGIIAEASGGNTNYAGIFNGNVLFNGNVIGSQFGWSDENLKNNINTIQNGMDIIAQLSPKTFFFDTLNTLGIHLSSEKQYGFIAQEIEQILPEMVMEAIKPAKYDSLMNEIFPESTFKTISYDRFIPILTKGIQEQQTMIDSLQSENQELAQQVSDLNDRLTNLENCLSNILPALCQVNNSMIQENSPTSQEVLQTILNIELFDGENIVLNQNVPNPFAESTVITYSIPESVQKAQLHFYNMSGQLIKTVDITSRGAGRMNVFGSDLSTGTYTYTLVADGQIVDTKRMVKSN